MLRGIKTRVEVRRADDSGRNSVERELRAAVSTMGGSRDRVISAAVPL
jgi:hypothetical protein